MPSGRAVDEVAPPQGGPVMPGGEVMVTVRVGGEDVSFDEAYRRCVLERADTEPRLVVGVSGQTAWPAKATGRSEGMWIMGVAGLHVIGKFEWRTGDEAEHAAVMEDAREQLWLYLRRCLATGEREMLRAEKEAIGG